MTTESSVSLLSSLEDDVDSVTVSDEATALEILNDRRVDCFVVDESVEGGLDVVDSLRTAAPAVPIVYTTATACGYTGAAATRTGATEYVPRDDHEITLGERVAALTSDLSSPDRASPDVNESDAAAGTHDAALRRIYDIVSRTDQSFDRRLEDLLAEGRSLLDVEYASLARVDGEQYTFETVSSTDDSVTAGETLPLSETYCAHAIETGDPLDFGAVTRDRPELADRAAFEELGITCYLGVPITVDDDPWGTLCFLSRHDRRARFTEWDRTIAKLLADWIGRELENRARRREIERIRASLEDTLERVDDAFFALDENWRFTYLNGKAEAVLDPSGRNLLGESLLEAFPSVVGTTFEDRCRHAMAAQEPISFEEYFTPLSIWVHVRVYPSSSGLSVYFADVTERKERERERRRYETIVETIDDGVLVIDSDQRVQDANQACADIIGWGRRDLVGAHVSTLVDDETWDEWMNVATSMAAGEREQATIETVLERADGTQVFLEATVSRMPPTETGSGSFVCVARDVTERTRREETITQLLETTRALFACETRKAVAETVSSTVTDIFEYDAVSVRLYDPDADELVRIAASPFVTDRFGDRERITLADSPIREALRQGEPLVIDDVDAVSPYEYGDIQSAMCVPIGSIGILVVGSERADAFDETHVQLAEVLAESAHAAFGRMDRREELLRYEQALEAVEEMVYALDAEGRFMLVTEPFAAAVGYDREELRGEHASLVLDEEFVELGERHIRLLLDDPDRDSTSFEAAFRTQTGDAFPVEAEVALLPFEDGCFRGTVGAVHDISERKEREQYLQVLNRVLRHNLRNDLTVVIGYADVLLEELEGTPLEPSVETLHETATDLARTSEKARAIQYALDTDAEPQPTNLVTVLEDVLIEFRASDPDATLQASFPDECWIAGKQGLRTIIENLLENALMHAGPEPTIDVRLERGDDHVRLSVADDGSGIPPEEIDVVTGERDITPLRHGSGLGLWLIRWIVDAHGGTVSFERSDLGGSDVIVELEAVESPDSHGETPATKSV